MSRDIRLWIAALCAALALHAGEAAAQETVTSAPTGRSGANLGFGYSVSGGLETGPNGEMRMKSHPRVNQVVPNSTSARAGLRVGDVILSVNGRDSRIVPPFGGFKPGDTIVLRIRRGDEEREVTYVWPRRR